jgi:hypothetical protein
MIARIHAAAKQKALVHLIFAADRVRFRFQSERSCLMDASGLARHYQKPG